MNDSWTLVACGCGTVNYWNLRALAGVNRVEQPSRVILCDSAQVRRQNAITCPGYAEVDGPKCHGMAQLARERLPPEVDIQPVYGHVEQLEWDRILGDADVSGRRKTIVIVGLDRWTSRLAVVEDLRHHAASVPASVMLIQVGLDRAQASVAVFGCRYTDPCPVCGIDSLPGPEPCVVLTAENGLLRGNLRNEAKGAAGLVRQIIVDHVGPNGACGWLNTKTNLILSSPGEQRQKTFTRSCRMRADCFGPHSPAAPIRWDRRLEAV